jgi:tetratricopeptide (TPR) repeat protein
MFESALAEEPWHRDALLGLADLEYRRGLHEVGLVHVTRVLQLDAYDAAANFVSGNIYRALDQDTDAREAYGWAARSMAYRSAAYVQLAELTLVEGDYSEATRYARLALDYDRNNIPARQVLAIVGRRAGDATLASSMREQLLAIDPLHHFVAAESYLTSGDAVSASAFTASLRSEYPDQTMLELAVDYLRRGAHEDARTLLGLGTQAAANPLLGAWLAWLDDDPRKLPRQADVLFVFPFRRETIPVLEWAAEHDDHWSWVYLLALNLWARDRADEAATLLESLDDRADLAPLYVSRAHLLKTMRQRDPEPDLRRAVQLGGSNRTIHIHLIRHLQDQGRWEDARAASTTAQVHFSDDFNLDLLQVRSLIQLGRPLEAIDVLNATHVLPSENARESHSLYEQAHTLAALDAMDSNGFDEAHRHLLAALEWPERLGQGRPYNPEERLVRYLLGLVEQRLGEPESPRAAFEAVVDATGKVSTSADRLDLLVIPSLVALGRTTELRVIWRDTDTEVGQLAAEIMSAVESGDEISDVTTRVAGQHLNLFDDLLGGMLFRALAAR